MTTNGNENCDKVRMSEQEEHLLNERLSYEKDPEAVGVEVSDIMCAAISIEEALYKLANYNEYKVVAVHETFMGEPIVSYYLVNKHNDEERHWIVYK